MILNALVERNDDGSYAISAREETSGNYICGYGDSLEEAKQDFAEGLRQSYNSYNRNTV